MANKTDIAPNVDILVEDCSLQKISLNLNIPITPENIKNVPIKSNAIITIFIVIIFPPNTCILKLFL